jgi:predicted nuclease of predicted toxin-antitoxin system
MTLLIDENLSPKIAEGCCDSVHALDLGKRPSDDELWCIAKARGLTILTKDTDFFDRMLLDGPPPKIFWLRVGNMRRRDLDALFKVRWPSISRLLSDFDLIEVFHHQIEALSFSDDHA